jgi:hypothetical protein
VIFEKTSLDPASSAIIIIIIMMMMIIKSILENDTFFHFTFLKVATRKKFCDVYLWEDQGSQTCQH